MIVFPLSAAAISGLFAVLLFRAFSRRKRLSQFAWGFALAQFAIASAIVAAGISGGWDPTLYRGFYLFGALLNVPWLALGSVALVAARAVARAALAVVVVASGYALVVLAVTSPDAGMLATEPGIPRGAEVWGPGSLLPLLARIYSIVGWLVVVGIAVWSSRARKGLRPPPSRVRANALIAAGTTVVAAGGFALRIGRGEAFSISLAAGVAVMFAGFLLAGRAPRYRVEDPGETAT